MANVSFGNAPSTFLMRQIYDQNFDTLEEILNSKVLFADPDSGANPAMKADIDMNGNDIVNVGNIDASNFSVEGVDLNGLVAAAEQSANYAEAFKIMAESFATDTFADRLYIDGELEEFSFVYKGALAEQPATAEAGLGTIYYNTSDSTMYVCYLQSVLGGIVQQNYWRPVAIDETNLGTAAYFDVTATTLDFSNPISLGTRWSPEDDDVFAACMTPDGDSVVVAVANELRQYFLNASYDITTETGTFDTLFTSQTTATNIIWGDGGFILQVLSEDENEIKEYSCPAPYRIDGATLSATRPWGPPEQDTYDISRHSMIHFGTGGTTITYMQKDPAVDNWTVYHNNLSIAYRIDQMGSTAAILPVTEDPDASAWIAFNHTGTSFVTIVGKELFKGDMTYQAAVYTTTTPYDVTGSIRELVGKYTFSLAHDNDIRMVQLLDNGSKLCVIAGTEVNLIARVHMFSLSNLADATSRAGMLLE